ncbi:MAG: hypothetical protein EOP49_21160 [Sphingobacteriales bacterium]|nr:MAG: hypothetical protein EOP49_21160 [Sphingobacteriales bacterium]
MDADLKNLFGVTLLAIKRGETINTTINGETIIQQDDILYVMGEPEKIAEFNKEIKL